MPSRIAAGLTRRLVRGGTALGIDLRVLEDGQFSRLLAAEWTSLIGDFALLPVIPFAVFELGGSATQTALVFGVEFLAGTLLVLFGGVAGDRYVRRSVMIGADLARFVAQIVLAVLFLAGVASIWTLVLVQVVLGCGTAFFRPALQGLIPQTVDAGVLRAANALRGVALALGITIGPAVGGAFLLLGDPGWAFALNGLTFGVSALFLGSLRPLPGGKAEEPTRVLDDLVEGWGAFRSWAWLWRVVVAFAILNALVMAPYFVLGPEQIASEAAWTAILAARGVGAVLGCVGVLRWQPQRPLLVGCWAVALWIPINVLTALAGPIPLLLPASLLSGVGLAVFGAFWETSLQGHPPPDQVSRLASYDWLGGMGLLPIGYGFAAAAAATMGAGPGLMVGAVILAAVTARLVTTKSIRELPPPPAAA